VQVAAQVEQVEAARREARDLREENSRWAIYGFFLFLVNLKCLSSCRKHN